MTSLEQQGLWPLALEYNRYSQAVGRAETTGIKIDVPFVEATIAECVKRKAELEDVAYLIAKKPFNMNSPKQIGEIIGQVSTKREDLEACEHPVAQLIVESRAYDKARGTYLEVFLDTMDENELIHVDMIVTGPVTGRMAIKRPAFNTLPRTSDPYKPEAMKKVRGAVIAREGYTLVEIDYSQVELRILAHLSGDPNLINAYQNGIDVHTQTAEIIGVPRQVGKKANFTAVYMAGPPGFVRSLRMDRVWLRKLLPDQPLEVRLKAERTGKTIYTNKTGSRWQFATEAEKVEYLELGWARNILDTYNERFPLVKAFSDRTIEFAKRNRYVQMWSGRIRRFPQLYSPLQGRWYNEARTAPNSVVQGGAAELLRKAITNIDIKFEKLKADGVKVPLLILAVHDSLLIEVPTGEESYWIPFVLWEMENVAKFKCPIVADAKSGTRWSELKGWERT